MMAITSPRLTERSMPLSTSFVPKRLRKPAISTMPVTGFCSTVSMKFSFQRTCPQRNRETQDEVQQCHAGVDREGAEGRVGDGGAGLGELGEPDHRRERR